MESTPWGSPPTRGFGETGMPDDSASSVRWEGLSLGQPVSLQAITGLCAPPGQPQLSRALFSFPRALAPTTTQASDLVRGGGCRICHLGPWRGCGGWGLAKMLQAGALEEQDPGRLCVVPTGAPRSLCW